MRLMTRSNLMRCSTGISVPRTSPQAPGIADHLVPMINR
jgi:hypothetical protein